MPSLLQKQTLRSLATLFAFLFVMKLLFTADGPPSAINSITIPGISEKTATLHLSSQEEKLIEYHQPKPDNMTVKKYSTDTKQFAASCSPDDLFQVKRLKHFNTSVAIPLAKKASCPRVLPSGVSGLPLTGLLSFPGAGSTWTRHILQELTGFPTGSIYGDSMLRSNGFPAEGEVENVLAVKSHVIHKSQPKHIPVGKFDRIIIVLRNVYDSLVAEYKRNRLTGSHTANSYINTSRPSWDHFMEKAGRRWKNFMLQSFDFDGPMLIVFYEDLKSQLLPQIIRVAEFLESEKLKEFSFCCVVKEIEGHFHRKSNTQISTDIFSERQKDEVNKRIRYVAEKLMTKHKEVAERLESYIIPL